MPAQQTATHGEHRDFSVAVIGAENSDQVTLGRIFDITRYRTRRYALTSIPVEMAPELACTVGRNADIFIVNISNPKALLLWSRMSILLKARARKPVIRLTRERRQPNAQGELTITYPINPAKVLQSLDNYTVTYLDFIPEFTIGSEAEPNHQTLRKIEAISSRRPVQQQIRKTRVLIADDSLAVRRQLKIEFDMLGADIKMVENGSAAVCAAESENYDIIFLDVVMPGMDGYTACKSIRKTACNRTTPVVILTSKSSKFDKLKGMLAGCDTYLTKPINHNEFTEITRKHLNKMEQYNDGQQSHDR